jgi:hypothetical protein
MIEVQNGALHPRVAEAVLFPFDDQSIPFSAGLRLHLVSGKPPGVKNPVVLGPGAEGAPDDARTRFYGTVIPVGDELRMWYLGASRDAPGRYRACYAVSRDGLHWERPRLGLVAHGGSRANNLLAVPDGQGGTLPIVALPVLHDPDDPDPARRFKCAFESGRYGNCLAVAFSPDGLRWTVPDWNPVGPMLEQTGLVRFQGCYYVNGQGGRHFGTARKLVTFASYDFEHWTQASCLGFRRDAVPPRRPETEWNAGEEVHLGAGLWDRGNVLLGVCDLWHGHPTGDRSLVTMDLGLLVSHDALHYREPVPDFELVPAREEEGAPTGRGPSLSHGQGLCNWGDRTLLWYELWGLGGVRLASWPRDRLGYFQVYDSPGRPAWLPEGQSIVDVAPHLVTCPLRAAGGARVFLNVEGVGQHAEVRVEVLDERLRPVPGLSGDASPPVREAGLRVPVRWRDRDAIGALPGPFRLRVTCAGLRPEDVKLYAVYATT